MTDGFPFDRDRAKIDAARHSQMPSAMLPLPAFDYADEYELNDIGLAMRLRGMGPA